VEAEILPISARQLQIAAHTVTRLQSEDKDTALGLMWKLQRPKLKLIPLPEIQKQGFSKGFRARSPFEGLKLAAHTFHIAANKVLFESRPIVKTLPWQPPPFLHGDDHPRDWPILGSAGTRDEEATARACAYGKMIVGRATKSATDSLLGGLVLCTDGSADSTGTSGGAAAVGFHSTAPQAEMYHCSKLGRFSTNYAAELIGIQKALELALSHHPTISICSILSDSQSAINAALSGHTGSDNLYWQTIASITKLKKRLRGAQVKIWIDWIPGHAGIPLNDRADALAGEASLSPTLPISLPPIPSQVARNQIKKTIWATLVDPW
jgi:ribonuclease HI